MLAGCNKGDSEGPKKAINMITFIVVVVVVIIIIITLIIILIIIMILIIIVLILIIIKSARPTGSGRSYSV